jgi:hypothetical protein
MSAIVFSQSICMDAPLADIVPNDNGWLFGVKRGSDSGPRTECSLFIVGANNKT